MCKGGSSGGGSSTVSQVNSLDPTVQANYQDIVNQAKNIAGPNAQYQQYSGQMVAGLTPEQTSAIGGINSSQGMAQPYYNTATGLASSSATPITPTAFSGNQVQQYMDPYLQNVVDSTRANLNANNQIQQSQLLGQAIQSGASPFGSDRAGVAAADLARQQSLSDNSTIANLYSQGYGQALGEFNTQQQTGMAAQQANASNSLNAAQGIANIGTAAQQSALSGQSAQLQAGTLEQSQNQNQLSNQYQQWLQQTYFPFETTSYLANVIEGLGNQMGSTSTSTSTPASPSLGGQIAGGVTAGLGILGSTGAFGNGSGGAGWLFKRGGSVPMQGGGGIAFAGTEGLPGMAARPHLASGGNEAGHNQGSLAGDHGQMGGQGGSGATHPGGGGAGGTHGAIDLTRAQVDAIVLGHPTAPAVADNSPAPTISHGQGVTGPRPDSADRWGVTRGQDPDIQQQQDQYNSAADAMQNRGIGDWATDHLLDMVPGFHQVTPEWDQPSSYADGTYHDAWSPLGAALSIAGSASMVPFAGTLGGAAGIAATDAMGLPDYKFGPQGGWSPDETNPIEKTFGTASTASPSAPQGPISPGGNETRRGTTYVPNALGSGPGAIVGPVTSPTTEVPTTPAAPTHQAGTPFVNPPTQIPEFGGLSYVEGPNGVRYPVYGGGQFGHYAMGGEAYPNLSDYHFGPIDEQASNDQGRAVYADAAQADPAPVLDTSGGTAKVHYPSNGESLDTGIPGDSIGSFFDNPWTGLAEAGLGMLASGSPYAGVAIGQGGLTGIQQFEQGRASASDTALRRQQAAEGAQDTALKQMRVEGLHAMQDIMNGAQTPAAAAPDQSATQPSPGPVPGDSGGMASSSGVAGGPSLAAPVQGAPQGIAAAAPSTAPQGMAGTTVLAPGSTKALPVNIGGGGATPAFNMAQLQKQYQVAAAYGDSTLASSIMNAMMKGVPEGAYLGQDGAIYPRAGSFDFYEHKALAEKGYVPNGAGGMAIDPGYYAGEVGLAGGKAGAAASAEFPYKVAEGLAQNAGRSVAVSPDQVVTTGLQAMDPGLAGVLTKAIKGIGGGAPAAVRTGAAPAAAAPSQPSAVSPQASQPASVPEQGAIPSDRLTGYMKVATDDELSTLAAQGVGDVKDAAVAEQRRRQPAQVAQNTQQTQQVVPSQDIGGEQSPFTAGLTRDANGNLISTLTSAGKAVADGLAKKYVDTDGPAYDAANNAQAHLDYIDRAVEELNNEGKGGWSSTGTGAQTRLGLAKSWNSMLSTLGIDPAKNGFDTSKIASWEDFNKESTRLGFDLARQMGSREAMMIVQQAVGSVPNAENSYLGARLVSQGLRQAAQRTKDFYQFETQWLTDPDHRGVLVGADVEFNKQHPVNDYVRRSVALSRAPKQAVEILQQHPEFMPKFLDTYAPAQ